MDAIWQSVSSTNVSQACLQSPTFQPLPFMNSTAYCAYKVPTYEHAQMCCFSKVTQSAQDECTFICPNGRDLVLLGCLQTILGTLNPHSPYPNHSLPSSAMSGRSLQMQCYDNAGYPYVNITDGQRRNHTGLEQRSGVESTTDCTSGHPPGPPPGNSLQYQLQQSGATKRVPGWLRNSLPLLLMMSCWYSILAGRI